MTETKVLTEFETKKILASYGFKVPRGTIVTVEDFHPEFEGPYVVKVSDPTIIHKTEAGGVVTNLKTREDLIGVLKEMRSRFPLSELMVEKMIPHGLEIIAGITEDPQFGYVIMVGLGGTMAELLKNRAFRLVPLEKKDALDMLRETAIPEFENGFRGISVSLESLADFVVRISDFVLKNKGRVVGIDLNPVIASGSDVTVADATIVMKGTESLIKGGE